MKYFISVRNGQLANAFIKTFEIRSINLIAPGKGRVDITNSRALKVEIPSWQESVESFLQK